MVAAATEFEGSIEWGDSSQDGQLRKRLSCQRMKFILPTFEPVSIKDGIRQTVNHYKALKAQP
jgi:nucleoside-diphosphate-sugar epimerase